MRPASVGAAGFIMLLVFLVVALLPNVSCEDLMETWC